MASTSYHKLEKPLRVEDEWLEVFKAAAWTTTGGRRNAWVTLGKGGGGRRLRRRWPRVRVAGLRRKARVVGAAVRLSVALVLERLREARPHLGELFAGSYMFLPHPPAKW
ncbi:hypothetical protein ZIOFF_050983 [Zingiber officinale]|uniref:Uncharacterized protein n=1 Tax=Zingiber officinale TaxID=94328 RepID=A0A8J5KRN7_ZINOF|nr:hypothetical protein ZIOFF_050983 [Zingiber officinale]